MLSLLCDMDLKAGTWMILSLSNASFSMEGQGGIQVEAWIILADLTGLIH